MTPPSQRWLPTPRDTFRVREAVFIRRFVPLVRSLISIPAGYNARPLPLSIGLSALGTTIWSAILAAAGWVLATN